MKTLKISLFALSIILFSCSKQSSSVNFPTKLTIYAVDKTTGQPVPYANVHLYASLNDLILRTGAIDSHLADGNGVVSFELGLKPQVYYWSAESDCKFSNDGESSTATAITSGQTTTVKSMLMSTGKFAMENISNSPFHVYIDGTFAFDVNGGSAKITENLSLGSHVIRCLQISGYLITPTDETQAFSLTQCGVVQPIQFN